MKNLSETKCVPCEGGTEPMNVEEIYKYLQMVSEWKTIDNQKIQKHFKFKNFKMAMKFINEIAEIAEEEGHHPDIFLHNWNEVDIILWTHAIKGLSINDFVIASKIDLLVS
jgi:4a-hydroxytetrahydrobiopterin dehydratase